MESRLKTFVANSILPISIYDREMRLLAASKPWKTMYQIEDEYIGQIHYKTFPDQPVHWVLAHQEALNGNISEHIEEPYLLSNGAMGWHRWQCSPWQGSDGELQGIIITAEDVTTRKEREIELNRVLARFELIQQAAHIGMWDWDITNRNITFNAEYYDVLGWNKNINLSNEEFYELIHPNDLDRVKSKLNAALSSGEKYEVEFRIFRHNDGRLRWVKDKGSIEFDENGRPVRGYGAIIDITMIKVLEDQRLRNEAEDYQRYIKNIPEGLAVVDRVGLFIHVNDYFADLLGFPANELIGASGWKYLADESREVMARKFQERSEGKSDKYQISLKHKDGTDVPVRISSKPIMEDGEFIGSVVIVVASTAA